MKKLLCLALSGILFVQYAHSQVSFGIKGGVNLATTYSKESSVSSTSDTRTAALVGGFVNIVLIDKLSFQPELLYVGYGGKESGTTLKADYIAIPLMMQYKLIDNFYAEAGLQPGFIVSAKADDVDVKDAYKSFDMQWSAGLGFWFNHNIGLGARYGSSLTNVADASGSTVHNRGLMISAHVKFF